MAHQMQIVLLGKSGHGKSATGNSILKRLQFPEYASLTSVTKMVERGIAKTVGLEIHVFDAPGPFETDFNVESTDLGDIKRTCQNMEMLIRSCSVNDGSVTAFFLVFNVTSNFSKEEMKTIDVLEKIFGDTVFTKFGVLVFTHGDNVEGDLTQFCQAQTGKARDFIQKFQNRRILISNKGSYTDERSAYGEEMIRMALLLKQSHKGYTLDQFNACKQNRVSLIIEHKIQHLSIDIGEKDTFDTEESEQLKRRCEKLNKQVDKKIEGTELKRKYINEIKKLQIEIKRKSNYCTVL